MRKSNLRLRPRCIIFTWAAGAVVVHVAGSLGMTLLGIGTVAVLRHRLAGA